MKHPLAKIFAPIGMVIFIAASSVVLAVDEFEVVGLQSAYDSVEEYEADELETDAQAMENVVARQEMSGRP